MPVSQSQSYLPNTFTYIHIHPTSLHIQQINIMGIVAIIVIVVVVKVVVAVAMAMMRR